MHNDNYNIALITTRGLQVKSHDFNNFRFRFLPIIESDTKAINKYITLLIIKC